MQRVDHDKRSRSTQFIIFVCSDVPLWIKNMNSEPQFAHAHGLG